MNMNQNIPTIKYGICMPYEDFKSLISETYRQGRMSYAIETGKEKAFYSYRQILKKYGRPIVDIWMKNRQLKAVQLGNALVFDKREVDELYASDKNKPFLCKIEY